MNFDLNANRVFRFLLICIAVLIALQLVWLGFRSVYGKDAVESIFRLVNFAAETNFPTLFTVLVMLANSLGCFLIAWQQHVARAGDKFSWAFLGMVFGFLAVDEYMSIHEQISRKLESSYEFTGIFHWAWVIPYAVLVAVVGLLLARFLWRLPRATAVRFVVSGIVYVAGALVLEMIEAALWSGEHTDTTVPIVLALVTLEEAMEMLGMVLFLRALLIYFRENVASSITVNL